MYDRIKAITSDSNQIHSIYSQLELNKGRLEIREVYVSKNLTGISQEWKGIKEVIKVKRNTKRNNGVSEEEAFFISSKPSHALTYFDGIRSH